MGISFYINPEDKVKLEEKYTELIRAKLPKNIADRLIKVGIYFQEYNQRAKIVILKAGDKYPSVVGAFSLSIFPDSWDIIISHDLYLREEFKNLGIGTILMELKFEIMKLNVENLNHILCIVRKDNDVELHMMEKFDWKKIYEMENHFMFIKTLKKEN